MTDDTHPAPPQIRQLVERFDQHRESYRSAAYNETQLRREFIDPFFKALGWDVDNEQGYAEAYKPVIHEDAIKFGGTTKAPDYSFRIGGRRKFFVETKKPSVNIGQDAVPAFQLRRYAWTEKLPLSVLTNFEEFAVYDCLTHRPDKTDKATTGRILYLKFTDYIERWNEIAAVFSPAAILTGSFDKYAETHKKKRGTAEVDAEFLKEIESWRSLLARNLALRNRELSQRDLNFAVQRTIDRIVFLRICEDRGIERPRQLQALLAAPRIYPRLCEIFEAADDRYNSGLFHFHKEKDRPEPPDELTPSLSIDDKTLKQILQRLYYPDSPYEFSVFPADILGQVYEQFLGKVIRLTTGHRATIEEKPEVKKAGGVFYTPTYVVDYIVEQTVGPLLEGSTPREIGGLTAAWKPSKGKRPLTILDPACGSGSFLIGAYQKLLDWHRDWYVAAGPEKHAERIYQAAGGEWRLTTLERKRVLLSHIYGVDIDPQAVEVTKLSLLLKVLEGENQETLARQLRLFKKRALPDLSSNIKCGNSLVGADFYNGRQMGLFDEEERLRVNVFDWDDEFAEVMRGGGFDAVVGNPPYVRMEMFKPIKQYLREHYASHAERSDLYVYFIEKEHELLRPDGRFGMIVSNKFIRAKYGEPLRKQLQSVATVERIVDLAGLPVFAGATVRTVLLITTRSTRNGRRWVTYSPPPAVDDLRRVESAVCRLADVCDPLAYKLRIGELRETGWRLIRPEYAVLMDRLVEQGVSLKGFTEGRICRGIVSGLTKAFVITPQQRDEILSRNSEADQIIRPFLQGRQIRGDEIEAGGKICMGIKSGLTKAFVITPDQRDQILSRNPEANQIIRPFLQGRQIRRYDIEPVTEYLIYTHHGIDVKPYPAVIEHLRPFRQQLEKRATKQEWYELQQPQFAYVDFLEQPKIVFPDIATGCRFALDTQGRFGANTVYFIPMADAALLGLLNSRLAFFFFQQTCAALEGPGEAYLRFFGQYLENFPVRLPPPGDTQRERLGELVEQIESQQKQQRAAKTGHQQTATKRQIVAIERQIDRLVYELYDLTDEEIRIVEDATQ